MSDNDFLDLSQVGNAESFLRLVDEGDGWDTAEAGPALAELKRSVLLTMDSLEASLEEKVLFLALALWQAARPRPGVSVLGLPSQGSLQSTARALLDRIDQGGTLAMLALFKEGKDFPKIIAAMANQLLEEPELQVDERQFVFDSAPPAAPADPGSARPAWEFFLRDSLSLAENRLPFGAEDRLPNGYHPARCEFRADAFPGRGQNRRALAWLGLTGMAQPVDLAEFTGTWLNLRAEAVLYFEGESFNLRRLNGSCNSDYEGDEQALARELGQVPLLRELPDGKLERTLSRGRPRTCAELAGEIGYQRLCWSDEGPPRAAWLAELHALNLQGPVLVTCHQGKARTSLALTALALRRLGARAAPDLQHWPEWRQLGEAYRRQDVSGLPAWLQAGQQRIVEQKARRLAERFALLSCYAHFLGQGQGVFEVQSALFQRQRDLMIDNLLRYA